MIQIQVAQAAGFTRVGLAFLFLMVLITGSRVMADDGPADQTEPPVRLKKKARPQPDVPSEQRPEPPNKEAIPKKTEPPPKSAESKEDAELNAQNLEEKIREITTRVAKNMSQAEQRLHKNDPGEATQQTQGDIVRDLDELIAQTMRQQQQRQQSGSSSSSPNQRSEQARKGRMQQNQASGRPRPSQNLQSPNQNGGNARGGTRSQEEMSKIADLYKDVWGHLPETLRQEMDQYSREQFMAKYGDLLKQYYATIAEKGRRKTEQ
jgi:hypothetical protein